MMPKHVGRYQRVVTFALALPALGGAAQAAEDEDEPSAPAPAPAPPVTPFSPKAEPQPAPPVLGSEAPSSPAPYIEHMGPETFPGRLRGLYGGSLWLEPTFHGLQWPQNTRTGLGISGQFWVDSGYEAIKRDLALLPNSSIFFQQGRGVLRVTPAYVHGNLFVQGQAELVGNLCQTASILNTVCNTGTFTTDDLWIRVGQWNLWDVKVGRFEGWEIYHLGMGLDRYTLERMGARMFGADSPASPRLEAPAYYGVSYLQDRPTDGLAVGYAALHAYLLENLRVELLGKLGTDNYVSDNSTGDTPSSYLGGRFAAIFDMGWFKVKAGGEYQKRTPTTQLIDVQTAGKKDPVEKLIQKGAGASALFVFDPIIEFGLSAAIGKQSYTDASGNAFGSAETLARSYTTKSVGGFANVRWWGWLVGAGANWTTQEDGYRADGSNANDYTTHLQGFLALQYLLARQLYIKAVLGYARARFQASDINVPVWNNDMYSGRLRLMYLY
jgi:hypothetical protein